MLVLNPSIVESPVRGTEKLIELIQKSIIALVVLFQEESDSGGVT